MNFVFKKQNLLYIIVFAIGLTLYACSSDVDKQLKEAADTANSQCPRFLDEWTRLDSCSVQPGRIYCYYHTISQPIIDTTAFKASFEPIIINKIIKGDPSMRFFRENGVTLEYQYNNANGGYICRIVMTPEKYK